MKLLINTLQTPETEAAGEIILLDEFSTDATQTAKNRVKITNARAIAEELPGAVQKVLSEAGATVEQINEAATNISGAPSMRLRICCAFIQGLSRALNIKAVGFKVNEQGEIAFNVPQRPYPQYDRDAGVIANVPEPIVQLPRMTTAVKLNKVNYTVQILAELTEDNLDQLYALEEELFARDKWSKESLEAAFHSGIYTFIVILDDQKNIAASSYLARRDENVFDIDSVGVFGAHQGKGVGNLLMESVTEYIHNAFENSEITANERIVNLEVRVSNERAINLYHKFGFKTVRQVKAYYKNPLEDALFMIKSKKFAQDTNGSAPEPTTDITRGITLGIESSCDETGVALVSNHHILAEKLATSLDEHIEYGGVIPEIAAREHIQSIDILVQEVLNSAKIELRDVENICVTAAPGLIGCLNIGTAYAKGLSLGLKKPLFGVNHLIGHLMAAELAMKTALPDQFLGLIVSGGHSDLLLRTSRTAFEHLGGTIDDAAGEAFDKVGRILGINYPAGKEIDMLAKNGKTNTIQFPRPLTGTKYENNHRYDFSFSGLKTAAIRELEAQKSINSGERVTLEDFCASFQEAVVDVLVIKTLRAAEEYNQTTIVLGGGFSANSRLRSKMQEECNERGIKLIVPEIKYCTDNGSMIANLGATVREEVPSRPDFSAKSVLPLETVVV